MLYLTMPYLRGESLNDSETRRGPYPVGEAVLLLVQVCHGLQHAHDLGVIHRDLKPENIMLVPDETVPGGIRAVVMDFGLGKAIQPDPRSRAPYPDRHHSRHAGVHEPRAGARGED